jgi:hypothetical protein
MYFYPDDIFKISIIHFLFMLNILSIHGFSGTMQETGDIILKYHHFPFMYET